MSNHVIKNYKPLKEKVEELTLIKILNNEDVLLELPLAVHFFGQEFEFPVIFGNLDGISIIQEAEVVLQNTKMFHFSLGEFDEEKKYHAIKEVDEKEATIHVRFPRDTKVDELISINGQILWAERVKQK